MFPIPLNNKNVAVLIVDLQNGYCDPQGDGALQLGWDCVPLQEICERHIPFINELRALLPPRQIIWARMEEHEDTIAPNLSLKYWQEFTRFCVRGTPGFEYHIVKPLKGEAEVFKKHPSAFHIDARVHTIGFSDVNIRSGKNILKMPKINLHDYLQTIGIDTIIFTGVLASRCVYGSIVGGSIFGYKCVCLTDLIAEPGGKEFSIEAAAHELTRDLFYTLPLTSKEFLSILRTPDQNHTHQPKRHDLSNVLGK